MSDEKTANEQEWDDILTNLEQINEIPYYETTSNNLISNALQKLIKELKLCSEARRK